MTCCFSMSASRPDDLRRPFGQFGPLKDIYLPKDYYSGWANLRHFSRWISLWWDSILFSSQWVKFSDHLSYFCLWFLKILHELATFFKCFVYLIVIKFSFKHVSRISLFCASLCVTGITLFLIVLLPYVTPKENKKIWKKNEKNLKYLKCYFFILFCPRKKSYSFYFL